MTLTLDPNRIPCPQCREPIAGDATVCPQCRSSALVDLLVEQAVSDPKLRYRAARALVALGPDMPGLAAAQGILGTARGRLLAAAKPGRAAGAAAVLEPLGIKSVQAPAHPGPGAPAVPVPAASPPAITLRLPTVRRGGGWLPWAAVAALGLAIAAGAWLWTRSSGEPPAASQPLAATTRGPAPSPGVAPVATSDAPPAAGEAPAASGTSGGAPEPTGAQPDGAAAARALTGRQLADVGLRSTVALQCDRIIGSGFFVSPASILTNAHVLCDSGAVKVKTFDGKEGKATLVRKDDRLDLALLKVDGVSAAPLPLGDAGGLQVGDRVAVVGSPMGMDFSVSQGTVSSMDRRYLGLAYLQTDTATNPGNSGGPMLDEEGRVVGVVSLKRMDAEGIGLALPINYAYAGQNAMVPAPDEPPSEVFPRLAEKADKLDAEDARKLSESRRPSLVAAQGAPWGAQAQLVWASALDPGRQVFTFSLLRRGERLCTFREDVATWARAENDDALRQSPQMKAWLERHGLSAKVYYGYVHLRFDRCQEDRLRDPGVVLEMEDADPDANRVSLW
jgi:serine protease Do